VKQTRQSALLRTSRKQLRILRQPLSSLLCYFANISSLSELAELKQPPWPKEDLLQRATMGRNTLRRQLERALQQQKEYKHENFEKLEALRIAREAAAKEKEEKAKKAAEEEEERQRKLVEERQRMQDQAREWAEAAAKAKLEEIENATDKKRRPRKYKKSNKESADDDDEMEIDDASASDTKEGRTKRKRRVARGNAISDEKVIESSEEDGGDGMADSTAVSGDEKPRSKKRKVLSQARIIDSDEEDEVMFEDNAGVETANGSGVHEDGSDDELFGGEEDDRMSED
jgi:RNA polymerase-associated protein CTR9